MDDRGAVRQIAWHEVFPWLILFRALRLSFGFALVIALAGTLLTSAGWRMSESLFLQDDDPLRRSARSRDATEVPQVMPASKSGLLPSETHPLMVWYADLAAPFVKLFRMDLGLTQIAYLLFGGLWSLAVWALLGAAITRLAVVRLGRRERVTVKELASHAVRKFGSYFAAPLLPLVAVVLAGLLTALLGAIMRMDVGLLLVGLIWILVLAGWAVVAFLLFGLLFGWPLMWPAISAEANGDMFEALQRSYSYTVDRPWHYLFYGLVSGLLGSAGWLLLTYFCNSVEHLAFWGASWGAGRERIGQLIGLVHGPQTADGALAGGVWMVWLSLEFVRVIPTAFVYSFFWCAISAIYLILRMDVDQCEFDEVFSYEDEPRGLPLLETDADGLPRVVDTPESPGEASPPGTTVPDVHETAE